MVGAKVSKWGKVATLATLTLLLQSCALPSDVGSPEPSPTAQVEKPHKYEALLSESFAEPWPEKVTRKEMIDTALFKAAQYLKTLPKEPCTKKAHFYHSDNLPQESVDIAKDVTKRMTETFCDLLTEDIYVIAGKYDFVKTTLEREQLPQDQFGGICGYDVKFDDGTACAAFGVAWVGSQFGTVRRGEFVPEPRRIAFITHELFHLIHDSADPEPNSQIPGPEHPFFRPGWLVEGAGEYFGALMPKYFGIQDYLTMVPFDRSGLFFRVDDLSDLKSLEVMRDSENYYSGQVAHEYITASVGLEPLIEIWVRMGQGERFEQAFESSVGIPVADFYEKFAIMHDNLYEGELVE
jgi:hypothetical protein